MRVAGVTINEEGREDMQRRLQSRLAKFASTIERVTIRLRDVNGPRGGIDHVCTIKVVMAGESSVVVESRDATARGAFMQSLEGAEGAVRQSVGRRRASRTTAKRRP